MSTATRIGQIGVGYWGRNLLRNFHALPDADVVHICDARADVRSELEQKYPNAAISGDARTLFEDDSIEGVIIATETQTHFRLARAALMAGKHVFVEKPMTQTVAEADELFQISNDTGLHVMVGHLLLYHPAFRYVEDLITAGDLGEVFYLYCVRVNLGIIRSSENALKSLAPHDIALAMRLLDNAPVSVAATGQSYLQPGIEDVAFLNLFFAEGQMAHLHTSWLDPHKIRKVTVVGSRKMAVVDDVAGTEKVRLYDKGVHVEPGDRFSYENYSESMSIRTGDIVIPKIDMHEPLRLECQHFVDCIRTGMRPRSDVRSGRDVMRILDAASVSMKNGGETVELAATVSI